MSSKTTSASGDRTSVVIDKDDVYHPPTYDIRTTTQVQPAYALTTHLKMT